MDCANLKVVSKSNGCQTEGISRRSPDRCDRTTILRLRYMRVDLLSVPPCHASFQAGRHSLRKLHYALNKELSKESLRIPSKWAIQAAYTNTVRLRQGGGFGRRRSSLMDRRAEKYLSSNVGLFSNFLEACPC
ncbi:unnamed protein product [Protopolystoma xenopodis]|uniref:Uncharacterized protein n=1 Tax=Protopolystoma xenopodis TaxID=117903 RepID=A0A448XHX0_9PLAT|nr:unnamed protein product [Protopolystoma xenopodis]